MASYSSLQYKVFISHAGEDKTTIALPLRERLHDLGIRAFVDEPDIPSGALADKAMTKAMETVEIAIIILSPEFVPRKWPMRELLTFLKRIKQGSGRKRLPVIIPLFYRLTIKQLHQEPRLERVGQNGKSLYTPSRFFERMDDREAEANVGIIKAELKKLCRFQGVENYVDASNESSVLMEKRRSVLVNELADRAKESLEDLNSECECSCSYTMSGFWQMK